MTKYIDADALKSHYSWLGDETTLTKHDVDDIVDVQPAADVAEVVHGAWVQERGNYATVNRCSVCGDTRWGRSRQTGWCDSQYCGACGAKMDLPFVPLDGYDYNGRKITSEKEDA